MRDKPKNLRNVVLVIGVLAVAIVVLGLGTMGCIERFFIYLPAKYPEGYWDTKGLDFPVEDVYFQTADGVKLHGFFSPYPGAGTTLLMFHGNAGNITHRLDKLRILRELEINLFIIDYRGYGRSEGSPTEQGLYQDSEAAYRYLLTREDVTPARIYIYGHSLGAAVAIYLADQGQGAGVIAEAGFSSLLDAAASIYPWLPAKYLTKERYDSLGRVPHLKAPILIIYPDKDEIIPPSQSEKLYQAAAEPKEFLVVKGADHNNTYLAGGEEYLQKIKNFLYRPGAASTGKPQF